jgi:hypothetical protein
MSDLNHSQAAPGTARASAEGTRRRATATALARLAFRVIMPIVTIGLSVYLGWLLVH